MLKKVFPKPEVDYRQFRLSKINEPQYKHLWFFIFWPIFGLRYLILECFVPVSYYHPIHAPIDDMIPFQELFLIPYVLWYVGLVGMQLYTLLYDVRSFKNYMKFLSISMTISTVIFIVYPSCQNLRPEVLPRDNLLTRFVQLLYAIDTNTNVFPSEHAIGALVILLSSLHTKGLRSTLKTTVITVLTILICLSTVFLKQHSILDVIAAIPITLIAYWICYGRKKHAQTL